MEHKTLYSERLTSNKTEALFIFLAVLFLVLSVRRMSVDGMDALAVIFIAFFAIFLFYSANYRTLEIKIDPDAVKLKFGIFTWIIPLSNIANCQLDELPPLMKYGGAGIHFMMVRGRYRASFNFLEHSRVVIAFKKKVGLVKEVSFSTKHPAEVLELAGNVSSNTVP